MITIFQTWCVNSWNNIVWMTCIILQHTTGEKKNILLCHNIIPIQHIYIIYCMDKPAHYGKTWTWNVIGELIDTIHLYAHINLLVYMPTILYTKTLLALWNKFLIFFFFTFFSNSLLVLINILLKKTNGK